MSTQRADYSTRVTMSQVFYDASATDIEKKRKHYEEFDAWVDWLETAQGRAWMERIEEQLTPL